MARTDSKKLLEDKVKVLEGAVQILKARDVAGRSCGICSALWDIQARDLNLSVAVANLARYIERVLEPHAYLWVWQQKKLGIVLEGDCLRNSRVEWCEWMLKCLKEDLAALSLPKKAPAASPWPFPRTRRSVIR